MCGRYHVFLWILPYPPDKKKVTQYHYHDSWRWEVRFLKRAREGLLCWPASDRNHQSWTFQEMNAWGSPTQEIILTGSQFDFVFLKSLQFFWKVFKCLKKKKKRRLEGVSLVEGKNSVDCSIKEFRAISCLEMKGFCSSSPGLKSSGPAYNNEV